MTAKDTSEARAGSGLVRSLTVGNASSALALASERASGALRSARPMLRPTRSAAVELAHMRLQGGALAATDGRAELSS